MRSPNRTAAAGIAAVALVAAFASPASAAGGPRPQVKVISDDTVYENAFTELDVRYRCAAGRDVELYAEIWQGGTADDPVSLYTTESPEADVPELECDGKKHTAHLGLILVGWTEDDPTSPYEYFGDTADDAGPGYVTVTLTDVTSKKSDSDYERVEVVSR